MVCKLLFDGQRISFRCFIPIFLCLLLSRHLSLCLSLVSFFLIGQFASIDGIYKTFYLRQREGDAKKKKKKKKTRKKISVYFRDECVDNFILSFWLVVVLLLLSLLLLPLYGPVASVCNVYIRWRVNLIFSLQFEP